MSCYSELMLKPSCWSHKSLYQSVTNKSKLVMSKGCHCNMTFIFNNWTDYPLMHNHQSLNEDL